MKPPAALGLLEYKLSRRDELDRRIAELALTPALAPTVTRLQCFRGVQQHAAMVLTTEIGDWRRFTSPQQLMAYLGLPYYPAAQLIVARHLHPETGVQAQVRLPSTRAERWGAPVSAGITA